MEANKSKRESFDEEIDLIELLKLFWLKKWIVIKSMAIFFIIGVVISLTSPVEYKTTCILIPEAASEQGKLGGSLGGLASLAGFDLGNIASANQSINPALYQSVAQSTPFLLKLMEQEYFFKEIGDTISIFNYYQDYKKGGLVNRIVSFPFSLKKQNEDSNTFSIYSLGSETIYITKFEQSIIDDLKSRVNVEMDWDLNVVTINVEMGDPIVAAKVAEFTRKYITNYVTEYSISKMEQQLISVTKQYDVRKLEFEKAQIRLAAFRDRNINVQAARARSEEERLESNYNIAFNVYNQLAQQLEAIKLQVESNKPVFTVLEPVKVPVDKSKPRRIIIVSMMIIIGGFVGFCVVLGKKMISKAFNRA